MSKLFRWIIYFFLFFTMLYKLISFIQIDKIESESKLIQNHSKFNVVKSDNGVTNILEWQDYKYGNFTASFQVPFSDIEQGKHNRLFEIRPMAIYPGEIDYGTIIQSGGISFMNELVEQLRTIALINNYDERQLADVIVSMVQNIPYTLIHQMSHESILKLAKEKRIDFLISYHNDPINNPYERELYGGCKDSVEPAGVYSPSEFISTLKGDCDTRTLFLYTLMKKMSYDVAILNGPGHSMLGCNLKPENPASPYLENNSSRYYFWETTIFYNQNGNTGPRLGDILDSKFNVNDWKIVLN